MLLNLVQFFSGSCEFKIGFLIIATIVKSISTIVVAINVLVESGFDMIVTSAELCWQRL